MLSILHQAIKFDCLFLAIFKVLLICELYFRHILALPPKKCLKNGFKAHQSPYHFKRLFRKCEKRAIFLIANFGRQANEGGGGREPNSTLECSINSIDCLMLQFFGGWRRNTEISAC